MTTQTQLLDLIKQIHLEKKTVVCHQYPFDSKITWKIPTVLNCGKNYTYFDGLFFWED